MSGWKISTKLCCVDKSLSDFSIQVQMELVKEKKVHLIRHYTLQSFKLIFSLNSRSGSSQSILFWKADGAQWVNVFTLLFLFSLRSSFWITYQVFSENEGPFFFFFFFLMFLSLNYEGLENVKSPFWSQTLGTWWLILAPLASFPRAAAPLGSAPCDRPVLSIVICPWTVRFLRDVTPGAAGDVRAWRARVRPVLLLRSSSAPPRTRLLSAKPRRARNSSDMSVRTPGSHRAILWWPPSCLCISQW